MHPSSNAFSLHDKHSSSPPPQQRPLQPSDSNPRRRSTTVSPSSKHRVAFTAVIADATMDVNGIPGNGIQANGTHDSAAPNGRKSKSTKRRTASSSTPITTTTVDDVQVEVLISPALQSQSQAALNGHAMPV